MILCEPREKKLQPICAGQAAYSDNSNKINLGTRNWKTL